MLMKRKMLAICLIAAALSLLSAGTMAYFTTQAQAANVITAGNISFEIHEKTSTGADYPEEPMIILPGDEISKIVTVENTGDHPMYLRVAVGCTVSDRELTAEGCTHLDINTDDWTEQDGYYYYNRALEVGETTQPLFTAVCIDGMQVDNAYLGKVFAVDVDAFAVQSENNGDSPLTALGWPEA